MFECAKDGCSCEVTQEYSYCSDECFADLPCGCEGCKCGSEEI